MLDDKRWVIGQGVIKTGHRLSGKEVQLPSSQVDRISWDESTVFVNLTKETILTFAPTTSRPPHAAPAVSDRRINQFARIKRAKSSTPADKLTTVTPPRTSNPASGAWFTGSTAVTRW